MKKNELGETNENRGKLILHAEFAETETNSNRLSSEDSNAAKLWEIYDSYKETCYGHVKSLLFQGYCSTTFCIILFWWC